MPIVEVGKQSFTVATQEGLFSPWHLPLGVPNTTPVFQSKMDAGVLEYNLQGVGGQHIIKGFTPQELLENVLMVPRRLIERGLPAAAQKHSFFARSVIRCDTLSSSDGMAHLPERVRGVISTCRLEAGGGELRYSSFCTAVSWMRTSLAALASVIGPLRELLEELLAATRRAKKVASTWAVDRAIEREVPWEAVKGVLESAVTLAYPKAGWKVPMFLDTSNLY